MSRLIEESVTIATGANGQSEAIDCQDFDIVGLRLPSTWVTSNINFYTCATINGTFVLAVDKANAALALTAIAASQHVQALASYLGILGPFVKIASVTTQTAGKTIGVIKSKRMS